MSDLDHIHQRCQY